MDLHLTLVGLNHRTASVDARERYSLTDYCVPSAWPTGFDKNFGESLILSTCNRVEFLYAGQNHQHDLMLETWARTVHQPLAELKSSSYIFHDQDAVRHIFKVASSLDSMVLGEPQILGQLKTAYRTAVQNSKTGPIISRLMHKAFSVGKRVRTETAVATNAVSVSYAAVELSKRIFGNLNGHQAMLIGAGEMAELAALHLLQNGIKKIVLINRTFERALELAEKFHGIAKPFAELADNLVNADIIIASTGSREPIVGPEEVKSALKKRKNNPMFFIDIAVPRDIHPQVNTLDNVYLYDIDDLREVVDENIEERKKEADKAQIIIEEETANFMSWLNILDSTPTIVDLINRGEKIARDEIARTLKKLEPLSAQQKLALETMALAIVRKMNHEPITFLKHGTGAASIERIDLVREIFNLDHLKSHKR